MGKGKKSRSKGNKKEEETSDHSYDTCSKENENTGNNADVVTEAEKNAFLRSENKSLKTENTKLIEECDSLKERCVEVQEENEILKKKIHELTSGSSNNNLNSEDWENSAMDVDHKDSAKLTSLETPGNSWDEEASGPLGEASAIAGHSGTSNIPVKHQDEDVSPQYSRHHVSDFKSSGASQNTSRSKNSHQKETYNRPQEPGSCYGPQRPYDQYTKTRNEGHEFGRGRDGRVSYWQVESSQSNPKKHNCRDHGYDKRWKTHQHNDSKQQSVYESESGSRGRGHRKEFQRPREQISQNRKVVEVDGDLFAAPKDHSLAHCVGADLRMGSGIAVQFRQQFKRIDELLDQRKKVGQVAILEDGDRYIYYLVTKKYSTGKPTMLDLEDALLDMRKHVVENGVKNIAVPRLGCGLDRLDWKEVRILLGSIFERTDVTITVYNFTVEKDAPKKPSIKIIDQVMKLADIEKGTLLVYFGSECSFVDNAMKEADEKFRFTQDYRQSNKKVGDVLQFTKRGEIICILIVKEHYNNILSYKTLYECLVKLRKIYKQENYQYMGFTAFIDNDDDTTVSKIVTLLKTLFVHSYGEVWICWPPELHQDIADEGRNSHNLTYRADET